MRKISIDTANRRDADQAIETVVLAFGADPAARWLYPDPMQYRRHFPSFVKAFAGKAFESGTAYSIDGFSGAAFWLPPKVRPDEQSLIALLQRTVSANVLADMMAVQPLGLGGMPANAEIGFVNGILGDRFAGRRRYAAATRGIKESSGQEKVARKTVVAGEAPA